MINKCSFGCGCDGIYQFKSGNICCSKFTSSCPAMKIKNGSKIKELRTGRGNNYWKNGHPKGATGCTWCKGKTYEELYGIEKAAELIKIKRAQHTGHTRWENVSDQVKASIASKQSARVRKLYESGWMPKAGRCEKIKYTSPIAGEVLLDGTWELIAAKYMDSVLWNWQRNKTRFEYINLNGKISYYTPDFYVNELNGYLEVKGYETDLDRCKWSQFKYNLTVWKKDKIDELRIAGKVGALQ